MTVKKYKNAKQFQAELARGVNGKIFLFLGEEEGEKDRVINIILTSVFKDDVERSQNTGRFYVNDDKYARDELMAAADFALSGSMFSDRRVCIIRNIENLKVNDTVKNVMDDIITSAPDGTLIIMTSMSNQAPAFIEKKYETGIQAVQFWKNFDSDLFNYIRKTLADRKIAFEEKIFPLMLELAGNDIKKIDELLDIITLTAKDTGLNGELLRDIAGDIKEISVFEFIDSLLLREKKSLENLKKLLDAGTADLLILNMIIRQVEIVEKYYRLMDEKYSHEEAMTRLGLGASKLRKDKLTAILKKINRTELGRIYPLIAKAEYGIKTGSAAGSIITSPVFILASEILSSR